jgi:hypothetical protein
MSVWCLSRVWSSARQRGRPGPRWSSSASWCWSSACCGRRRGARRRGPGAGRLVVGPGRCGGGAPAVGVVWAGQGGQWRGLRRSFGSSPARSSWSWCWCWSGGSSTAGPAPFVDVAGVVVLLGVVGRFVVGLVLVGGCGPRPRRRPARPGLVELGAGVQSLAARDWAGGRWRGPRRWWCLGWSGGWLVVDGRGLVVGWARPWWVLVVGGRRGARVNPGRVGLGVGCWSWWPAVGVGAGLGPGGGWFGRELVAWLSPLGRAAGRLLVAGGGRGRVPRAGGGGEWCVWLG